MSNPENIIYQFTYTLQRYINNYLERTSQENLTAVFDFEDTTTLTIEKNYKPIVYIKRIQIAKLSASIFRVNLAIYIPFRPSTKDIYIIYSTDEELENELKRHEFKSAIQDAIDECLSYPKYDYIYKPC